MDKSSFSAVPGPIKGLTALKRRNPACNEATFLQPRTQELQMSFNDCLRNIAAGNPAHRPDGDDPKRCKGAILAQAHDVYKHLANGLGAAEVAQKCEDPMSLGIGAMLAKMSSGGLIREPGQVIDLLNGVFLGERLAGLDPNRRTNIEALQNLGILPRDINVR